MAFTSRSGNAHADPKGTGSDNGFGDNSVGRKIALFVPAFVTITPALLALRFETRLPFALSR
ncbi:hypothetical protein [Marivita sp.]|uniref:hypothetical protein n=1 Tax=Marivita sp. TaxID=2003365 RepID=UPI003B5A495A